VRWRNVRISTSPRFQNYQTDNSLHQRARHNRPLVPLLPSRLVTRVYRKAPCRNPHTYLLFGYHPTPSFALSQRPHLRNPSPASLDPIGWFADYTTTRTRYRWDVHTRWYHSGDTTVFHSEAYVVPSAQFVGKKRLIHELTAGEDCFVQPNDFIPERWTTRPELIKDRSAFFAWGVGWLPLFYTPHVRNVN
jgi:hypothetical protein